MKNVGYLKPKISSFSGQGHIFWSAHSFITAQMGRSRKATKNIQGQTVRPIKGASKAMALLAFN